MFASLCVMLISAIFIIALNVNSETINKGADKLILSVVDREFSDLSGIDRYDSTEAYKPTLPNASTETSESTDTPKAPETTPPSLSSPPKNIYDFDHSLVPEGDNAIIPLDLSLSAYGNTYINNDTGLIPDTEALLKREHWSYGDLDDLAYVDSNDGPLVLIVHTHGTEAFNEKGIISVSEDNVDPFRSTDTQKNVVSLGKIISDELNNSGISTIHCSIMHDEIQYKDSYTRAEETIKKYLERYPSIKLVIDVHRDSIVKSNGDYVRAVTEIDGEATAQVMCVIGSSWGGDECPSWENNLSLALKLRQSLNEKYNNICRPPYLKSSTYNQEIPRYSMLLEIGSSGNDLQEAQKAASIVAKELSVLLKEIK